MVVRDGRRDGGHPLRFLQGVEEPAHGARPHGGAVAPGAIGMTPGRGLVGRSPILVVERIQAFWMEQPVIEAGPISAHRARTLFGEFHHRVFQFLVRVLRIREQPPGDSHRHDAVVRVAALGVEEREVVVFRVVELVDGSYGVPDDRSQHNRKVSIISFPDGSDPPCSTVTTAPFGRGSCLGDRRRGNSGCKDSLPRPSARGRGAPS